jgi:hypothetical protein
VKVWNIDWVDEDGNYNVGTALFAELELAEAYLNRMLMPMVEQGLDGNTYTIGELAVVTEL